MALTPSTMNELGQVAPEFSLTNATDGTQVSLSDFADQQALLVMFICNHCPYVVHVLPELTKLGSDYVDSKLGIVAINSNSITSHPEDGPQNMRSLAKAEQWSFPFLFDHDQSVARDYQAACTPDFFLYQKQRDTFTLAYRGQLDDSRPGNQKPLNGHSLRAAIDAVLSGNDVAATQQPSVGCNIKWN